jgi:hypothetical protein
MVVVVLLVKQMDDDKIVHMDQDVLVVVVEVI